MLRNTFLHLPQIGPATERAIWELGITTWESFLDASSLPPRARNRRDQLASTLDECVARLIKGDASYFDRCLPMRDRWRMYPDFRETTAFLDIETTGLSPERSYVTLVGIRTPRGTPPTSRERTWKICRPRWSATIWS